MQTWINSYQNWTEEKKQLKFLTLVYILTPILDNNLFIPLVEVTSLCEEGTNLISDVLTYWIRTQWISNQVIFGTNGTVLKFPRLFFFIKLNWLCFELNPLNGYIFSSLEPKAQVSFSDQNLSVLSRRCRRRCRKLFTFSSSSPEPLGKFQPNLAHCILG